MANQQIRRSHHVDAGQHPDGHRRPLTAVAFIFADLIIIPILDIYRKYYGGRVSLYLFAASYATMAVAGLVIGSIFEAVGAVPISRSVSAFQTTISWDYNTFLDIGFLLLIAVPVTRFLRTGGAAMLREMNRPSEAPPSTRASSHVVGR